MSATKKEKEAKVATGAPGKEERRVWVRFQLWTNSHASEAGMPCGPSIIRGGATQGSNPPFIQFVSDTPEEAEVQRAKLEEYLIARDARP